MLCGQVSRGRVYRRRCAESSPEEESTGVVAWKTLPGKSLGVIIRHCVIDDIINVCMIATSQEALSICTTLGDCVICVIRSLVYMPHLRRHYPNKHVY